MTSPTRDQIAQTIETAISDAWWERGGKKVSTREQARAAADALSAAGLIVPSGFTAERLRHIANMPVTAEWCSLTRRQLLAWATSLDTREER